MAQSALRLIRRWEPYVPIEGIDELPAGLRGIYVLYKYRRRNDWYDVVYVGMSASGVSGHIKRPLRSHRTRKSGLWSHFSVFEVWDNIPDEEIWELEGLFRQIYKWDSRANALNKQRGFKKLGEIDHIL